MTNRTFWRWCYAQARDEGLSIRSATAAANGTWNRTLQEINQSSIQKTLYFPRLPKIVHTILAEEIQRARERS